MTDTIKPIEVQEFISSLVQQIENGVDIETRHIEGTIDIEIEVEEVTQKEGGLKIYVANGKVGSHNGRVSKARFSVRPKQSQREKDNIARMRQNSGRIDSWIER